MTLDRHATMADEPGEWRPVRDGHGKIWCEYHPARKEIRIRRGGRVATIALADLADGRPRATTHSEIP